MTSNELVLVTGANGHLGNNLVRLLVQKGYKVRASVRNIHNKKSFEGVNCEVIYADITDKDSMIKAMNGVSIVFAVAAVFKLWAKHPKEEIYDTNMKGCRILFEAASFAQVKRIVYVSSIAALNYSSFPVNENSGYNTDRRDMYYNSKNDSEKLAFQLSEKYNIELVTVLPSAMIGSVITDKLSNSNEILKNLISNKIPLETHIYINWIDVKDVAQGCYMAAIKGRKGERYILANEKGMSLTTTIEIANQILPELKLKKPKSVPKFILYSMGYIMGIIAKITGKAPAITEKEVSMFYGLKQDFNISKAKNELEFSPIPSEKALKNAILYMWKNKEHFL